MSNDDLPLDADGHLLHFERWSPAQAQRLADLDGIKLGAEHWPVLHYLREQYQNYGRVPPLRLVVRALSPPGSAADSRPLYRLFGESPLRQACRAAGIPRPEHCF